MATNQGEAGMPTSARIQGEENRWQEEGQDDTAPCETHGEQAVVASGDFTGFAGGACAWAELACGCTLVDESADIRAAY